MQSQVRSEPAPAQPAARVTDASSDAAAMGGPPGSIAADINAAFMFTITTFGLATSFAVLIFGGALEPGMPRAIGTFLVGSGLMAILIGWRSSIVPVATYVQDGPAILMAVVAADFIAIEGTKVTDVFVLFVVTVLAAAVATALIGHFGLGGIGRKVPTPVVDAFVAGIGWLLLKGSFEVTTASTLGLGDLDRIFQFELAKFWGPGITIGFMAWLCNRSQRAPDYAFCLVVCGSLAAFYPVVVLVSSISAVEAGGWLLGPFPEPGNTRLVTPNEFRTANWSAIIKTTPGILGVVAIACLSQLTNLTGIRSTLAPGLNADDELRACAAGNLAAAPLGVIPGFQSLGCTLVLHRMGSTRRAVPLICGGIVVVSGMIGVVAVGYVPRFIVGAMLTMIGLTMLHHWIQGLTRTTSRVERLLGVATVGAIAWFGLLEGLAFGLLAAGFVFLVSQTRLDPVRSVSNGWLVRSRAERSQGELEQIMAAGDRLVIAELQGYLFFGSVPTLEDQLRTLVLGIDAIGTLVVDFAYVTGMDGSARAGVARMLQEFQLKGISIRLSALDPAIARSLLAAEPELAAHIAFPHSLDAALKSAEDQVLASTPGETPPPSKMSTSGRST